MEFNKSKYWIVQLGQSDPGYTHRLRGKKLKSGSVERNLEFLVQGKLNMSQQCPGSQEGRHCPGGHQDSITSRTRDGIVLLGSALLCSALPWGGLTSSAVCVVRSHNTK
ncbi:hypothetical protein DUI87_07639 [Hirundo rustica rustica]|uniref:Uncharacterized protein n=1 Tax=Hirundo rustica rustica TaxID=333673 RepID=A0A3M0KQD3_HIRRU|nr:hypothetical protein DUI87_07639 [Hirundo rustica rustica]